MIKDLRKLDSTWRAEQIGFGYWCYSHPEKNLRIEYYAHVVDAELELFASRWHLFKDNENLTQGSKISILIFLQENFDKL